MDRKNHWNQTLGTNKIFIYKIIFLLQFLPEKVTPRLIDYEFKSSVKGKIIVQKRQNQVNIYQLHLEASLDLLIRRGVTISAS